MKQITALLFSVFILNAHAHESNDARGPHFINVKTAASSYSLTGTDDEILASTSAATTQLTLPSAASYPGKVYKICRTDQTTYSVVISRSGSDTIDGAGDWTGSVSNTQVSLNSQNDAVELVSDGTSKWSTTVDNRTVAARVILGTTSSAFTAGSQNVVPYDTKTYDTHGAISGLGTSSFKFTAPVAGRYRVTGAVDSAIAAWSAGNSTALTIYVNNSVPMTFTSVNAWAALTTDIDQNVADTIKLAAGDYVQLLWSQNRGGSLTTAISGSSDGRTFAAFERIGN